MLHATMGMPAPVLLTQQIDIVQKEQQQSSIIHPAESNLHKSPAIASIVADKLGNILN